MAPIYATSTDKATTGMWRPGKNWYQIGQPSEANLRRIQTPTQRGQNSGQISKVSKTPYGSRGRGRPVICSYQSRSAPSSPAPNSSTEDDECSRLKLFTLSPIVPKQAQDQVLPKEDEKVFNWVNQARALNELAKEARLASNRVHYSPPRKFETDPVILMRRSKQIGYGKNTAAYRSYLQQVSKASRTRGHPVTPDRTKVTSRRGWDGEIKVWRLLLHAYGPDKQPVTHQDLLTLQEPGEGEPQGSAGNLTPLEPMDITMETGIDPNPGLKIWRIDKD